MRVIETQSDGGLTEKTECDFCMEEPESGVLIEKPNSMILNGKLFLSHRPKSLYICLNCLIFEIKNF